MVNVTCKRFVKRIPEFIHGGFRTNHCCFMFVPLDRAVDKLILWCCTVCVRVCVCVRLALNEMEHIEEI